jgi:two-component system, NarL family, sensor histidine kinase DesK
VFTWDWSFMQWFVVASAAMTLPRPLAAIGAAGPILVQTFVAGWYVGHEPAAGPGLVVVFVLYNFTLLATGSAALVGSGWLARTLAELDKAQHQQAELAAMRERVRLSRDLHDLLGHSLATASLQGDLALTLLPTEPAAARAEMEGMATAARRALDDIQAVTYDEHAVTLAAEIAGATTLLGAAGIHTVVDLAEADLARPVEEALAWAVREAGTNTLRHSQATTWSLTTRRADGRIRLTIVNDGVPRPAVRGGDLPGGLVGVAARARALSGHATADHTADGHFRLDVEIPEDQR